MKVLTVRQPWASLISLGVKRIETRSWSTSFRGPLAIHAGKAQLHHGVFFMQARQALTAGLITAEQEAPFRCFDVPFGAVVAVCDLVDVVPIRDRHERHEGRACIKDCLHEGDLPHQLGGLWLLGVNDLTHGTPTRVADQRPFGDFTPGRFAWLLDNVRPLDDPVPMKGAQGLRDLPPDIAAAITRALTEGATRCLT